MMISVKKKNWWTVKHIHVQTHIIVQTSCSKCRAKLPVLQRWHLKVVSVFVAAVIA